MPKQELLGEVKKLINLGKEKGFLTYDDLNSTLPVKNPIPRKKTKRKST